MRRREEIQAASEAALAENARLRAEIEKLRSAHATADVPVASFAPGDSDSTSHLATTSELAEVTGPADKAGKVTLFRSLFREKTVGIDLNWT